MNLVTSTFTIRQKLVTTAGVNRSIEMKQLSEYYRIPDPWVRFSCSNTTAEETGYFTFGEKAVCYGRCASVPVVRSVKQSMPDAFRYAQVGENSVHLPFDLDEVVCNLQNERYTVAAPANRMQEMVRNAYYLLRPSLAVRVRKYLQRVYLSGWKNIPFPNWPVDQSVGNIMQRALSLGIKASGTNWAPFIWFWPEGQSSCCIVTHDVETAEGRDFCSSLMDLDDSCGMKSAFQVIPENRYEVPASYLASMHDRGFEVNVHDLNHDGMLFSDEKTFMQRVVAINQYGRQFGSRGFRAGIMYRNQEWFHALDFEYDMSVPNAAHLEPQRGGCCTIMPYFIGNIVELPLTTTQDYTMFHILGERGLDIWEREIDTLHRNHGLISILAHPDYLTEPWAQEIYVQLLSHISARAFKENIWLATPGEVNDWWRVRSKLSLTPNSGGWQITGDGCDRARIAYASLDGENVRYSFDSPANQATGADFDASLSSRTRRAGTR
jgi:hypothetical protein